MNTVLGRYVLCAMLTAAAAAPAIAQDGPPPPPGPGMGRGPDGPFMDDMGRHRAPVTGLPYSAATVTEMTQTLADGNRISRKTEGRVIRDSAGRTRREHTLTGLGPMPAGPEGIGNGRTVVMIDDPVAKTRYVLDPERKVARQMPAFSPRGGGPGPGFKRGTGQGRPDAEGERPKPLEESLGTKTIEGLEAQGTRRTMTIPAGQIGNDQPIEIVTERWYAPALQAVVVQTISDPRVGDRSFRLTNITRGEPAAASFQVPPDYKVVQGARPGGGKHRRSPADAQ